MRLRPASGGGCAGCDLNGGGKDGRTGAIVLAVEVLAVLPGIPVLRLDPGRGGGGGRRIRRQLRCVSAPGGSCRLRWLCRLDGLRRLRLPSLAVLVLPGFPVPSGEIQGVEVVEVGGSGGGGWCWPPADPVGCAGWPWLRLPPSLPAGRLRHSCGPASLRRRLRCVSARWAGEGWPYRKETSPKRNQRGPNLARGCA